MFLWIPVFILFSYPMVYGAIPHLLLKRKVWQFFLFILVWGVVGLYINAGFRTYLYVPLQATMGFDYYPQKVPNRTATVYDHISCQRNDNKVFQVVDHQATRLDAGSTGEDHLNFNC